MHTGILAAVILQAGLLAQTLIVDASNGPGTNFTSLPAAVAAAPNGAIIIVRPGSYAGFTAVQKGLVILGEAGVTITSQVRFDNLTPTQSIALHDLHFLVPPPLPRIEFRTCRGPILVEGCVSAAAGCTGVPTCNPSLMATRCPQLVVRDTTVAGPVYLATDNPSFPSAATFERCVLYGDSFPTRQSPTEALNVSQTTVQLVSCFVRGGNSGYFPGAPPNRSAAVASSSSTLRVLGTSIHGGGGLFPAYAVEGATGPTSAVRVDLVSSLIGVSGPTSGVTLQSAVMPHLLATSTTPSGTLVATTTTEVGDLVALAVGFRATPSTLPGFPDAFWFDANAHVTHFIATQPAASPVTGTVTVPNAPGLVGLQLAWHAVCFGPLTGLQNTNPAISLIH